jgi:hypothetical protein
VGALVRAFPGTAPAPDPDPEPDPEPEDDVTRQLDWILAGRTGYGVRVQAHAGARKPYGEKVDYADPGLREDKKARYPIDTADHVRAALSYIGQEANRKFYTAEQLKTIEARIRAAAKRFGIEVSDDTGK